MTTSRPARTALGLLIAGSLGACGSEIRAVADAPPDLQTALTVDLDGFEPGDVPPPPDTVCEDSGYSDDPVPVLPRSLGDPTSAGFRAEDAELHAWAWRTATAEDATAVVDEAVAGLTGCGYQVHFDSDTDGDGEIDAGGSDEQHALPWSDDTWTGLSISGSHFGNGAELTESRFVRSGTVVLLVVLTIHGNDDARRTTVPTYLDGVAERLR